VLAIVLLNIWFPARGWSQTTQSAGKEFKIFSGEPRLMVVNGYSTSFHWWAFLQHKIDGYYKGKRIIEVQPATRGKSPIARWMDVKSGERKPVWEQTLQPALKAKKGKPAIVLAQQSLQMAFGSKGAGIRNKEDKERIKQGADILEKFAKLLIKDGADEVFIAMHIYKKPMEPRIGNERLALAELMKRKIAHVHAGPDVWEPTSKLYPQAFAKDKKHPNSIGSEIMAQLWFETLLKHDGLEVPAWSKKEMADAIEGQPLDLRSGEYEKLLKEWKIEVKARAGQRGNHGQRGMRQIPQDILKKYDTDGDGKMSREERKQFMKDRRKGRRTEK
jgi:hypothetical protein